MTKKDKTWVFNSSVQAATTTTLEAILSVTLLTLSIAYTCMKIVQIFRERE